jgi:hypothetical protein
VEAVSELGLAGGVLRVTDPRAGVALEKQLIARRLVVKSMEERKRDHYEDLSMR